MVVVAAAAKVVMVGELIVCMVIVIRIAIVNTISLCRFSQRQYLSFGVGQGLMNDIEHFKNCWFFSLNRSVFNILNPIENFVMTL